MASADPSPAPPPTMRRRLGQVHGGRVGRQHLDHLGVERRGRPPASHLDDAARRLGRDDGRGSSSAPRTPGCRVATNGPSTTSVVHDQAALAGHGGAVGVDRDGPGQQRPVEQVGQAGRQVATVGRRRAARPRRSSASSGASAAGPGGRGERRPARSTRTSRRDAGERRRRLGRAVAHQQRPGPRPRPPPRRRRAGRRARPRTGTRRDHSAAPTRLPSITAAWARRGATQSPTRSTVTAVPPA